MARWADPEGGCKDITAEILAAYERGDESIWQAFDMCRPPYRCPDYAPGTVGCSTHQRMHQALSARRRRDL